MKTLLALCTVLVTLALVAVAVVSADYTRPPHYPPIRTQPPIITPTPTPAPFDCYIIVRGRVAWYPCEGGN